DALGIKKAIVCGLSMGGYVLLDAVNRYPERFKAIILSDTQCADDTTETKEKRYKTMEQIEEGKLSEYANAFIKTVFCKETLNTKKQLVEKIKNGILATSPKTIIATLKAMALREEKCSILNKINVPALIICGKEDMLTPIARSEILFKGINNSSIKIISDAGHLSNLEQPAEFNKCLANFIATLIKEK
ncbi:MAG: alpha/beta fold hydrolase, partial [Bacteroidia bacterium]